MSGSLRLTINGEDREIGSDGAAAPLLSVLRDLGLTGAKYGCGAEQCYACAVIVEGEVVPTCVSPASDFVGRRITTIEGVARDGALHPVQRAFVAESAGQCGYCIPALVLRVVALRRRAPTPTERQLREELSPHLCRCGAHASILRAARRALIEPSEAATR